MYKLAKQQKDKCKEYYKSYGTTKLMKQMVRHYEFSLIGTIFYSAYIRSKENSETII